MLIKSSYKNILLNIDPKDVTTIYMTEFLGMYAIMIEGGAIDEDGNRTQKVEVGRYRSEETAQKNYDGLIKFFQSMVGRELIEQTEIFYMTPNE